MAIVRFSEDSDVYVYESASAGGFDCCGCILTGNRVESPSGKAFYKNRDTINFSGRQGIIEHLEMHRAAGHKVPDEVFSELRADFKL